MAEKKRGRLVTIAQLAEILGRPAPTIRAMCKQGRMPGAIKPGVEWLVDPTEARRAVFLPRGRQPKE